MVYDSCGVIIKACRVRYNRVTTHASSSDSRLHGLLAVHQWMVFVCQLRTELLVWRMGLPWGWHVRRAIWRRRRLRGLADELSAPTAVTFITRIHNRLRRMLVSQYDEIFGQIRNAMHVMRRQTVFLIWTPKRLLSFKLSFEQLSTK